MADTYRFMDTNNQWSPPLSEKEIIDRIWQKELRPNTRMSVEETGRLFHAQENPVWREAFHQTGVPCNPMVRPPSPQRNAPRRPKLTLEQYIQRGGVGLLACAFLLWLFTLVFPNVGADAKPAAAGEAAAPSTNRRAWLRGLPGKPFVQAHDQKVLEYFQNYRFTYPDKYNELQQLVDGENLVEVEHGDGKEVEVLQTTPMMAMVHFPNVGDAKNATWWVEADHVTYTMPESDRIEYNFSGGRRRGSNGRSHYSPKYGR